MTNHHRRMQTRRRRYGTGWSPADHNRSVALRRDLRRLSRAARRAALALARFGRAVSAMRRSLP